VAEEHVQGLCELLARRKVDGSVSIRVCTRNCTAQLQGMARGEDK